MKPRYLHPENLIRIFLGGGVVCLLAGQAIGSSILRFIGGVMIGVVLIPAMILGPVMLTMRVFGLGRPDKVRPAQHDGEPDSKKSGE